MDTYRAIEALCDISRDLVATHGSEEYNEISATYPSKAERDLRPAAFAIPRNRDDVVAVLDTLKHFGDKVPLAIAGAGLLPVLGSANVEGGITIHMCHFKGIQINSDNSIVRISPGETWESLCEVLEPRGLSVSGSRGDVSTKDGTSSLSSNVADNVVNYEVVLASGEVANANANANSDLFSALQCGSGNNVGIVTRFDVSISKQEGI